MEPNQNREPESRHESAPSFVEIFGDMPDPRIDRNKDHQLLDIFVVTLCAVLTGAEHWTEIEQFGKVKLEWLRKFIPLENGIPSHDTFGRVFSRIDPEAFAERFLAWVRAACGTVGKGLVAIDGKTLRRSCDAADDKAAIHMVSAWAAENRLVLAQVKTDEKSNEITAIPELLKLLDLGGCIVTIDAMGCQKKIARQITKAGGDYVLGLKGNQTKLKDDVERFFACAERDDYALLESDTHRTVEKDHGRIETREYRIVAEDSFETKGEWGGLKAVGMARSERIVKGKTTNETRYFICSRMMPGEAFARAVRGHWGIENSLHWVLDVAFREDECRIRKDHAPENLALVRHMALNLLRQEKAVCKLGVKGKRHRCAIDEDYMETVLGI